MKSRLIRKIFYTLKNIEYYNRVYPNSRKIFELQDRLEQYKRALAELS